MHDSKYASIKPYAEKAVSPTAKVVTDGGTNLISLCTSGCRNAEKKALFMNYGIQTLQSLKFVLCGDVRTNKC